RAGADGTVTGTVTGTATGTAAAPVPLCGNVLPWITSRRHCEWRHYAQGDRSSAGSPPAAGHSRSPTFVAERARRYRPPGAVTLVKGVCDDRTTAPESVRSGAAGARATAQPDHQGRDVGRQISGRPGHR